MQTTDFPTAVPDSTPTTRGEVRPRRLSGRQRAGVQRFGVVFAVLIAGVLIAGRPHRGSPDRAPAQADRQHSRSSEVGMPARAADGRGLVAVTTGRAGHRAVVSMPAGWRRENRDGYLLAGTPEDTAAVVIMPSGPAGRTWREMRSVLNQMATDYLTDPELRGEATITQAGGAGGRVRYDGQVAGHPGHLEIRWLCNAVDCWYLIGIRDRAAIEADDDIAEVLDSFEWSPAQ